MVYGSSSHFPSIQEAPSPYSPFSRQNLVYEVSLRTSSAWLQKLHHAHRLVQGMLQGEVLGDYELLDFLIWPEGILFRISLKKAPSLAEAMKSLKEKSTPTGGDYRNHWEDEPQWIRLVTPENLSESNRFFQETARAIQQRVEAYPSTLYFLYRNSRLGR